MVVKISIRKSFPESLNIPGKCIIERRIVQPINDIVFFSKDLYMESDFECDSSVLC